MGIRLPETFLTSGTFCDLISFITSKTLTNKKCPTGIFSCLTKK